MRFVLWKPSDAETTFAWMVRNWWPMRPTRFAGVGGKRLALVLMWRTGDTPGDLEPTWKAFVDTQNGGTAERGTEGA